MTRNDFTGKRVAVYVRSAAKRNLTSARDQMRHCLKLVTQSGGKVPVVNRFKDAGISGTTTHRPALDRLMEMVRARQLDLVVVKDIDRISRDLRNVLAIFEELARNNVELIITDALEKPLKDVLSNEVREFIGSRCRWCGRESVTRHS